MDISFSDSKKVTKPFIEVDEKFLEKLTKLHLSDRVISDILQISEDTLHRRYADKMAVWRGESKAKIAEILYDEAINNRTPWALKLYAQRFLGFNPETIKVELTPIQNASSEIPVTMTIEERIDMLEKYKSLLMKKIQN